MQRLSKLLLIGSVALLAACDSASDLSGPELTRPAVASHAATQRAMVDAPAQGAQLKTTETKETRTSAPAPQVTGRSRYAMAAN